MTEYAEFLDTLTPEARGELALERGAPAVVTALFELKRDLSARQLAACATALGRPVSKSTAAVWRKRLASGEAIGTPGEPEDLAATPADNARARLAEAARTGNGQEAVRWAMVLQRLQGLPSDAPLDDEAGYDWSRLTDAEFGQLDGLLSKARGEAPAADRAPGFWPDPHPASMPLPALVEDGALTPDGKAVVADVVDGVMRDVTKRLTRVGKGPKAPGPATTRA
jgi:hypothetical protein